MLDKLSAVLFRSLAIGFVLAGLGLGWPAGLASAQGPRAPLADGAHDNSRLTAVPSEALNTKIEDLEGNSLKLSALAGQVVIVNFWATWCGPCRNEMPELVRISDEYRERGVTVIGVATSGNDSDIARVKEYVKENNISYRIFYEDGTVARALMNATNARAIIPQTFVITRDGRIFVHFEGFNARSTPPKLREMIDLALAR